MKDNVATSQEMPAGAQLTPADARLLCEAHEIEALLANFEEMEILEDSNPRLLEVYQKLAALAKKA